MENKQDFLTDVHETVQAYQKARQARKEMLGPDLLDTAVSLTKTTISHLHDRADQVITSIQDRIQAFKQQREERRLSRAERMSLRERIANSIQDFREFAANHLDEAANRLRGYTQVLETPNKQESTQASTTQQEPTQTSTAQQEPTFTTQAYTEQTQPTYTTQQAYTAKPTQGATQSKKRQEAMSQEEILAFAQYYYDHHDRVVQAVEAVDRKEQPTFKDYAIASGFHTFWKELKGDEQTHTSPQSSEDTAVQQVIQDVNQLKQAQQRLHALDLERQQLEQEVSRLSDRYQLSNASTHAQETVTKPERSTPSFDAQTMTPPPIEQEGSFAPHPIEQDVTYESSDEELASLYDMAENDAYTLTDEDLMLTEEDLTLTEDDLSEFAHMDPGYFR